MGETGYASITADYSGQSTEATEIKENPIIIIPGVMGSRLFTNNYEFDDSTRIWDPVMPKGFDENDIFQSEFINRITDLGKQLSSEGLYVRKMENQNYDLNGNMEHGVKEYGREYGAQNTYKELVEKICENFPGREVYFFSYDWRESNTNSAIELYKAIYRLNIQKADFVCHSMGGLVISEFYNMYRNNNQIGKVITCATPYEGAPKLINSIMNMDVLGEGTLEGADWKNDLIDIVLGTAGGLTKELKASFIGVGELLPTKNYVTKVPMQELSYRYNANTDKVEESGRNLSYEEYVSRCEGIFKQKKKDKSEEVTYDDIKKFQEGLLTDQGYNRMLDYGNTYYAVGGGQKTIVSIRFNPLGSSVNKRLYESDLNIEDMGDGTVPYQSATMMGRLLDVVGEGNRCKKFPYDHTDIIKRGDVIEWISEILKN